MLRESLRAVGLFVFSAVLLGCTARGCTGARQDIPPEEQLHSYINAAVNVTKAEQRAELVDLTTGPLKAALINASAQSFKRAYIDKKYDFRNFEIIQRKDAPGGKETQLDFKLVYKSWNAGETADRAPVVETSNRATLIYEHGQWAIEKVDSLGSNFEWDVGLPMDAVSTEGVDPEGEPKEIQSSRQGIDDQRSAEQLEQNDAAKEGAQP
jgi:hypothetical protein